MQARRYAILGTGALGGFYGARLQRAGCEVHFLLHHEYEHVRQHGLKVESKDGDFVLSQVRAYADARDLPPCDVVVVAFKATQNHLLESILPLVVRPKSVVLIMQNGLGLEDQVAQWVRPARVLGGLCFLCSNKIGPGHIRHLDYGYVRLAEYHPGYQPAGVTDGMRAIQEDLTRAGIQAGLCDDLFLARWQKLVWNIPYNGLSVILNATTAELMGHPHTRCLVEAVMREVVAGASACGRSIPESFIVKMLDDTARMAPYRTSMKIDFDEGRAMEVEAIYGQPLRTARQAGAVTPLLEVFYQQLKFLDERNQSGTTPR